MRTNRPPQSRKQKHLQQKQDKNQSAQKQLLQKTTTAQPPKHRLSIRTGSIPKFHAETGTFSKDEKIRATIVQFSDLQTNKPIAAGYLTANPKAEEEFSLKEMLKGKNRKWVSLHIDSKNLTSVQVKETLRALAVEIRKKADSQKIHLLLSIPGTKFGERLLQDRGYIKIEGTPVWKYEFAKGRFIMKELYFGTTTRRNFEMYSAIFKKFLKKGNHILDLGTGQSTFVKEAQEKGINAVGLDAQYSRTRKNKPAFGKNPRDKNLSLEKQRDIPHVKALAQDLPFRSNSFDSVISLYGALFYSRRPEHHQPALYEALRVVKPGKSVSYYPAQKPEFYAPLKKAGFKVEFNLLDLYFQSSPGHKVTITKPDNNALAKLKKIWAI